MKKTKKEFKEVLNNWYYGERHRNHRFHQRVRLYGDYMYSQDNVKSNMLFNLWQVTDTREMFENKQ